MPQSHTASPRPTHTFPRLHSPARTSQSPYNSAAPVYATHLVTVDAWHTEEVLAIGTCATQSSCDIAGPRRRGKAHCRCQRGTQGTERPHCYQVEYEANQLQLSRHVKQQQDGIGTGGARNVAICVWEARAGPIHLRVRRATQLWRAWAAGELRRTRSRVEHGLVL